MDPVHGPMKEHSRTMVNGDWGLHDSMRTKRVGNYSRPWWDGNCLDTSGWVDGCQSRYILAARADMSGQVDLASGANMSRRVYLAAGADTSGGVDLGARANMSAWGQLGCQSR